MKKLNCILLIDDDIPTNFYNRKVIEKLGCANHVEIYERAKDGLEFLKSKFRGGKPPQPELIFLDLNMPGMDGWEFLEAYNALPDPQKGEVVIVMLTTSVNPEDKRRALERGIKGFAKKPLNTAMLEQLITENFPS